MHHRLVMDSGCNKDRNKKNTHLDTTPHIDSDVCFTAAAVSRDQKEALLKQRLLLHLP